MTPEERRARHEQQHAKLLDNRAKGIGLGGGPSLDDLDGPSFMPATQENMEGAQRVWDLINGVEPKESPSK